jgi:hypothetical protein
VALFVLGGLEYWSDGVLEKEKLVERENGARRKTQPPSPRGYGGPRGARRSNQKKRKRINHESTKIGKHEKKSIFFSSFVLSSFRAFVIKIFFSKPPLHSSKEVCHGKQC